MKIVILYKLLEVPGLFFLFSKVKTGGEEIDSDCRAFAENSPFTFGCNKSNVFTQRPFCANDLSEFLPFQMSKTTTHIYNFKIILFYLQFTMCDCILAVDLHIYIYI